MTATPSILVSVDGSPASDRAAAFAAKRAKAMPGTVIHLLNVQASMGNLVSSFVPKETIDAYRREEGAKALASAVRICTEAGVPFEKHIGVGRPGEVVGQFVKKLGAETVVTGTRGHGGVAGVLMGSVTQDIIAHVDVPITLVK